MEIKLSVVIPCFQAESTIAELCKRLEKSLTEITDNFEIILVDDGSQDRTWDFISRFAKAKSFIHGIKLSRNFGQHNAITAGLEYGSGDWFVVMDCDLQDRPEEIISFYGKTQAGYQVVVGIRNERKDNLFKRVSSLFFYSIFQRMTGSNFNKKMGNFGIYSKKVIDSVLELKEQHKSFGLMVLWVGFSRAEVSVTHDSRGSGKSNYRITHRIALAVDSIVSHTNNLLYLAIKVGLFVSITSLLFVSYLITRFIFFGITTEGWTSLAISIYFTLGLLLAAIGVLGVYIGKVFNESKGRPIYIVESKTDEL
jgi:dolichol-phosphate mannosyltransferase